MKVKVGENLPEQGAVMRLGWELLFSRYSMYVRMIIDKFERCKEVTDKGSVASLQGKASHMDSTHLSTKKKQKKQIPYIKIQ